VGDLEEEPAWLAEADAALTAACRRRAGASGAEHQTRRGCIMDSYIERQALRSYSWEQRLPLC
jgi:hypothetical protein